MAVYEWKNTKTGEVVDHDHWSDPPDNSGNWQRLFFFATGRVEGAGTSPSRPASKLKGSNRGN